MKLGLYFAVFNHLALDDAFSRCCENGISVIELSCHTGGRFCPEQLDSVGGPAALRRRVADAGLTISAINMSSDGQLVLGPHHADTDVVHQGPPREKIAYGTSRMLRSAELANELEVAVVTGFTGCEDYARWFPWPDDRAWEKSEAVFVERWAPILRRFDELGVTFAMEAHPKQFVYNIETARRSLELLGRDGARWAFNFDPANLVLAGVDPVVFIAELGKHIMNVHAKDAEKVAHHVARSGLLANGSWDRPDRGFRFRVAGWGDLDWRRIITELVVQGYNGPLTIEHEDPTMGPMDGVEKAVAHLRPLLIKEPFPGRWW